MVQPGGILATASAGDMHNHAKRPHGGHNIGEQVNPGGFQRQGATYYNGHQQVAHMGDGRVAQQALQVRLEQGQQVATEHAEKSQQADQAKEPSTAEDRGHQYQPQ